MSLEVNTIKEAFEKAHSLSNKGKFKEYNGLKSAKFVFEVGRKLEEKTKDESSSDNIVSYVQKVDDEGNKEPGEWLLDIVIAETTEITDPKVSNSKAIINSKIIWAVESESALGLPEFAEDFGKLLAINSEKYLYLNGVNPNQTNFEEYVERRLNTTNEILDKLNFNGELYFGFWPSPAKEDETSGWENDIEDLLNKIRLYKWDADFVRF